METLETVRQLLLLLIICGGLAAIGEGIIRFIGWYRRMKHQRGWRVPTPAYDERNWQEQFEKEWHA